MESETKLNKLRNVIAMLNVSAPNLKNCSCHWIICNRQFFILWVKKILRISQTYK